MKTFNEQLDEYVITTRLRGYILSISYTLKKDKIKKILG
jgi:hypothetical protein